MTALLGLSAGGETAGSAAVTAGQSVEVSPSRVVLSSDAPDQVVTFQISPPQAMNWGGLYVIEHKHFRAYPITGPGKVTVRFQPLRNGVEDYTFSLGPANVSIPVSVEVLKWVRGVFALRCPSPLLGSRTTCVAHYLLDPSEEFRPAMSARWYYNVAGSWRAGPQVTVPVDGSTSFTTPPVGHGGLAVRLVNSTRTIVGDGAAAPRSPIKVTAPSRVTAGVPFTVTVRLHPKFAGRCSWTTTSATVVNGVARLRFVRPYAGARLTTVKVGCGASGWAPTYGSVRVLVQRQS